MRCRGAGATRRCEAAEAAAAGGFSFFLLEGFGAPFAEVGEVDEADGLGFQEVLGGGGLGGEARVGG